MRKRFEVQLKRGKKWITVGRHDHSFNALMDAYEEDQGSRVRVVDTLNDGFVMWVREATERPAPWPRVMEVRPYQVIGSKLYNGSTIIDNQGKKFLVTELDTEVSKRED